MRFNKSFFILLFISSTLSSCFNYKDLSFNGVENLKLSKIEQGELNLSLDIKLENPNNYKIKIKPTDLQIYVSNKELGSIRLDKKLVIKKNSSATYPVVINTKLRNAAGAGIGTIMELSTKKSVHIQIKGPLKGSVYGFTKKVVLDETKVIDLQSLKIPKLF
jgi:LEA14-like dessication related protein